MAPGPDAHVVGLHMTIVALGYDILYIEILGVESICRESDKLHEMQALPEPLPVALDKRYNPPVCHSNTRGLRLSITSLSRSLRISAQGLEPRARPKEW